MTAYESLGHCNDLRFCLLQLFARQIKIKRIQIKDRIMIELFEPFGEAFEEAGEYRKVEFMNCLLIWSVA